MSLLNYERPSLTTDLVLFRVIEEEPISNRKNDKKKLQVLLINRKDEPQKGKWSLPGGFVNIDEEISDNVLRKLEYKTGITGNFYLEQLYTFGGLERDERGRVVSVSYLGLVNGETHMNMGGSEEQKWFDVQDALNMELAFDHKEIIKYGLERLKGKAEYTDIVFNLLPSEFTINDAKEIYELLFEKKMDNFHRRISKYVTPLNKARTGKQFRPAELFAWKRGNKDD